MDNTLKISKKPDVLNILRFTATMMVFLLHGRSYVPNIQETSRWFRIVTCFPAWAGVWIFLFISGYLMELGFERGNHPIVGEDFKSSILNTLKFYWSRFLRMAPPYYIYCILFEILNADTYLWNHPWNVLFRIITFTYDGSVGITGFGHLWYISLAMQLYLISPFIYLIIRKINSAKINFAIYVVVLLGFLGLRYYLVSQGVAWYKWIYTFFAPNIDMLVCGMLVYRIRVQLRTKVSVIFKVIAAVSFIVLIAYNNFIYQSDELTIYQLLLPSVYIVACSNMILAFHNDNKPVKVTLKDTIKAPWLFADWFAKYSYAYYIFHLIIFKYAKGSLIANEKFASWGGKKQWLVFFVFTFLICTTVSVIYTKMVDGMMRGMKKK